jgi:Tfp pilus assembly protein PilZ
MWYADVVNFERSPTPPQARTVPLSHFRVTGRRQVSAVATLTLLGTSQTVTAHVRNVGLGGLCVEVDDAIAAGQDAVVMLSTAWLWEPLRLQGAIVWVRADVYPAQVGIAIHHESYLTVKALYDFLGLRS